MALAHKQLHGLVAGHPGNRDWSSKRIGSAHIGVTAGRS
jgi:hypothetical protein